MSGQTFVQRFYTNIGNGMKMEKILLDRQLFSARPDSLLDLTVIILTKNEKLHIARCLDNVNKVADKVYVIDCQSTDGTQEIARRMGAEVVEHDWPGNQAAQFNWVLDNINIDTEWIFRLDADEYLTDELVEEIRTRLPKVSDDVTGIIFKRFCGWSVMGMVDMSRDLWMNILFYRVDIHWNLNMTSATITLTICHGSARNMSIMLCEKQPRCLILNMTLQVIC